MIHQKFYYKAIVSGCKHDTVKIFIEDLCTIHFLLLRCKICDKEITFYFAALREHMVTRHNMKMPEYKARSVPNCNVFCNKTYFSIVSFYLSQMILLLLLLFDKFLGCIIADEDCIHSYLFSDLRRTSLSAFPLSLPVPCHIVVYYFHLPITMKH